MNEKNDNPYSTEIIDKSNAGHHKKGVQRGFTVPASLIFLGLAIGILGLVLVSNKYGNTDTYGLLVVPTGAYLLAAGICNLFVRLRYAIMIAIIAAPVSLILLFVLYWILIFATAAAN